MRPKRTVGMVVVLIVLWMLVGALPTVRAEGGQCIGGHVYLTAAGASSVQLYGPEKVLCSPNGENRWGCTVTESGEYAIQCKKALWQQWQECGEVVVPEINITKTTNVEVTYNGPDKGIEVEFGGGDLNTNIICKCGGKKCTIRGNSLIKNNKIDAESLLNGDQIKFKDENTIKIEEYSTVEPIHLTVRVKKPEITVKVDNTEIYRIEFDDDGLAKIIPLKDYIIGEAWGKTWPCDEKKCDRMVIPFNSTVIQLTDDSGPWKITGATISTSKYDREVTGSPIELSNDNGSIDEWKKLHDYKSVNAQEGNIYVRMEYGKGDKEITFKVPFAVPNWIFIRESANNGSNKYKICTIEKVQDIYVTFDGVLEEDSKHYYVGKKEIDTSRLYGAKDTTCTSTNINASIGPEIVEVTKWKGMWRTHDFREKIPLSVSTGHGAWIGQYTAYTGNFATDAFRTGNGYAVYKKKTVDKVIGENQYCNSVDHKDVKLNIDTDTGYDCELNIVNCGDGNLFVFHNCD